MKRLQLMAHALLRVCTSLVPIFIGGAFLLVSTAVSAQSLLIEHVTLIDGTGRPPAPDMFVLVTDGRIAKIQNQPLEAPVGIDRVDGRGRFLIPGLIDTHIHLAGGLKGAVGTHREMTMDKELGRHVLHGYLFCGVTSVYDAGNNPRYILEMRNDERSGRMVSPRIFAAVRVVAPSHGYLSGDGALEVKSYEQGITELDKLFRYRPDIVKFSRDSRGVALMPQKLPLIPIDAMAKLIHYTKRSGYLTTAHVVDESLAREATEAGIDRLAHPLYHSIISEDLAEYIARKKLPVSTTLTVIRNISRVVHDPGFFDEPLFRATLSAEEFQYHRVDERNRYLNSQMHTWTDSAWPKIAGTVRKLHEKGAILALGTDRTVGALVHQELEYLVETGISAIEAIRIGTLNGAIYLGKEQELGSIEPGKLGDMVLLKANPATDIHNSRNIEAVFKSGRRIELAALELPVNDKARKHPGPVARAELPEPPYENP